MKLPAIIKWIKITVYTSLLFTWSSGAFASNFAETYGFSAQGIALGNAMTARVNDWSSVFYNIAGLGRTAHLKDEINSEAEESSKGNTKKKSKNEETAPKPAADQHLYANDLAITYLHTIPDLYIDISRTDQNGDPLSTDGDDIGSYGFYILGLTLDMNLIYKMPSFISSARIGFSIGVNDDFSLIKINDVDGRTHNFMRYGREAQRYVMLTGAGIGFLDDMIGLGAGVNVSLDSKSTVILEDVNLESGTQVPNGQTKMDLSISPALLAGIYLSPGKLFNVLKGLELGTSYRQEIFMEVYPFNVSALALDNAVVMQMVLAIMDYYSPHIFTFGTAYTLQDFTFSADIEYHMWSEFKINAANNQNYINMPEFKDIFVYRLGAEWKALKRLSVMCGAYYQPSFIPESASKGVYNFLENDRYTGSTGVRFAIPRKGGFGGPVDITASYQLQYLVENSVTKDEPTTFNPDYKYGGMSHSFVLGIVLKL